MGKKTGADEIFIGAIVDVLDEAKRLISGSRREAYGSAHDSFSCIASLWSTYLSATIKPVDVAMMMVLLKVAREKAAHGTDNLVDICGYAALAEEVV